MSAHTKHLFSDSQRQFVTSISHELRTPVTSLSGSLDLLQHHFSKDLPSGASRLVAMAMRNADQLLMLINDILTVQALDEERYNIKAVPLSVDAALNEAITLNAGYGFKFKVSLVRQQTTPSTILADPDRIQQVFSNLISNAIKYSPENGVVSIGATQIGDEIEFFVRDNGPGIPVSARGGIFERFSEPAHCREIQRSGSGLGLAITKRLVELQNGIITFKSQSDPQNSGGSGTTFYVKFKTYSV